MGSRRFYRFESSFSDGYLDHGLSAEQENKWVFDVAWEVVNKVGGIYTVLRSKAQVSTEELGEQYCMVGPCNEHLIKTEVEVEEPAENIFRDAIKSLRDQGIRV